MCLFKKKVKPLNTTVLRQYKAEAYGRLSFSGGWSGYWETRINGVRYRGETVSGLKAILGDTGNFVLDAIIDRVRLRKYPEKYQEDLDKLRYGGCRYVCEDGRVEQWNW